ncbi:hypothetical protein J3F83DRAFT_724098, partial [Trichoderma novae-zelandiae]
MRLPCLFPSCDVVMSNFCLLAASSACHYLLSRPSLTEASYGRLGLPSVSRDTRLLHRFANQMFVTGFLVKASKGCNFSICIVNQLDQNMHRAYPAC